MIDRESAGGQRLLEFGQPGIVSRLQGGRLLRDPDVVRDTGAQHAANAGNPCLISPISLSAAVPRPPGLFPNKTTAGFPARLVS